MSIKITPNRWKDDLLGVIRATGVQLDRAHLRGMGATEREARAICTYKDTTSEGLAQKNL